MTQALQERDRSCYGHATDNQLSTDIFHNAATFSPLFDRLKIMYGQIDKCIMDATAEYGFPKVVMCYIGAANDVFRRMDEKAGTEYKYNTRELENLIIAKQYAVERHLEIFPFFPQVDYNRFISRERPTVGNSLRWLTMLACVVSGDAPIVRDGVPIECPESWLPLMPGCEVKGIVSMSGRAPFEWVGAFLHSSSNGKTYDISLKRHPEITVKRLMPHFSITHVKPRPVAIGHGKEKFLIDAGFLPIKNAR